MDDITHVAAAVTPYLATGTEAAIQTFGQRAGEAAAAVLRRTIGALRRRSSPDAAPSTEQATTALASAIGAGELTHQDVKALLQHMALLRAHAPIAVKTSAVNVDQLHGKNVLIDVDIQSQNVTFQ